MRVYWRLRAVIWTDLRRRVALAPPVERAPYMKRVFNPPTHEVQRDVAERQRMSEHATLQDFIDRHRRLFILTGAGCSTPSGIPDYRDADGQWKRDQPVTYQAFMGEEKTRRRYWARSLIGWRLLPQTQHNPPHAAL